LAGEVAIDDIAPAICFLLSDDAKRITGAELAVDGGWTAGKHLSGPARLLTPRRAPQEAP
jgi:NAD(P)-dependent dehydrogenase (short-subunit alcohol dehydrogenase family)